MKKKELINKMRLEFLKTSDLLNKLEVDLKSDPKTSKELGRRTGFRTGEDNKSVTELVEEDWKKILENS